MKSLSTKTALLGVVVLGATFAAGIAVNRYWMAGPRAPEATSVALEHEHAPAEATYVCPMHPHVIADKPGTCPICGMALVPVKPSATETDRSATDAQPVVTIAPEVVNNLGVKTMRVTRTTLVRRIETPGFVQQIEPAHQARVVAPFEARIAGLYVRPGQRLELGKPLVTLESEALRAAEQAHLDLLKQGAPAESAPPPDAAAPVAPATGQAQGLTLDQSREQLGRLGLSVDAIRELEEKRVASSKLTLYAPFAGAISDLQVAARDMVPSGAPLFELAGEARAEVLANAFQRDAAWIQPGQDVSVRLPHVSSRTWPGVVNQGAVSFDPNSQNIGVRLSFTAPMHLLKSGMYVVATIHGDARRGVLAIPQEALIRAESEDRVIVALGNGRFKPMRVRPGIESGGQVEILEGLKTGDEVVVSAQFLIDSESSLRASFRRMTSQ
jgi:Cu(I)/Ag(I) efflux system membrane fusion protein